MQKEILHDLVNEVYQLIGKTPPRSNGSCEVEIVANRINAAISADYTMDLDEEDIESDVNVSDDRPQCQLSYELLNKLTKLANESS